MMNTLNIIGINMVFVFFACTNNTKLPTTSGTFNLGVDETMKNAIDEVLRVYQSQYGDVEINIKYLSEAEVIEGFANNTFNIIIVSNLPDSNELVNYHKQNISVENYPIAVENVFFEVNKNATVQHIKNIVFSNIGSSFIYALEDSIRKKYVKIYSKQMINDLLSNNVQYATITGSSSLINNSQNAYIKPHSAFGIKDKRIWYVVNGEPNIGAGSGFVAFLRGVRGQKILSKCNLTPAIPSEVLVNLKSSDLVFSPEKINATE